MADPFTLSLIATNCAWALIQNRTDAAAVASAKRLGNILRKQRTPAKHDVLKATHAAFVRSIQLMAEACEQSGADARDHFAARALARLARDKDFTTFRADVAIPREELEASIRAIFESAGGDPDRNAAEAVIVRLEAAMGEPLTESFRALFRRGSASHRSWPQAFELFFAEQVKANEPVFRALAFERTNEILALAEMQRAELATVNEAITAFRGEMGQGFADSAERDWRMENKLDIVLEQVLSQRGGQIEEARIDPQAIVRIARKVSENVAAADQALAEIDAAIDDLLALRRDAAQGSNLDALVEPALQRIDERAAAGEFDAAAREAEKAYAEWESRETDRRERERAVGIRFAEENVRTHRLRRDADAAAAWIWRRASLEPNALAAASSEISALIESGSKKGINLDLEIAISLAVLLDRQAQSDQQTASLLVSKAIALSRLGERREGTEMLDEAIAAFRTALAVHSRDHSPLEWAMSQNNLGSTLWQLGERREGMEALDEAVTAFRAALEVYTRDQLPLKWAMTQSNLGIVLHTLGERRNSIATLSQAATAFSATLGVYTRDERPLDWAMSQHNLGCVLMTLGERRSDTKNLEYAVAHCRAALEVRSREELPLDWAMTQNNLGNALSALAERQQGTESLSQAVVAFRAALDVRTRQGMPVPWAMTQHNLGRALATLGERQEGTDALDQAVAAYHSALEVRTRDRMPLQWAMSQENLGYVLHTKAEKLGDRAVAGEAVAAFESALAIYAHPDLAWNRAKAARGLAAARALRGRLCGSG